MNFEWGRKMRCILGAPLSEAGGVTITGLDLSTPLPVSRREQLPEAFRIHHVMVFPEQGLSRENQFEFIANFGWSTAHDSANTPTKPYAAPHVTPDPDKQRNPANTPSRPAHHH